MLSRHNLLAVQLRSIVKTCESLMNKTNLFTPNVKMRDDVIGVNKSTRVSLPKTIPLMIVKVLPYFLTSLRTPKDFRTQLYIFNFRAICQLQFSN